jgi:uncharacterized membrane protein
MANPPRSTSHHASEDSWYAELEQLVQRYEHGELSDDEFSMEKQRILRQSRRRRAEPAQLQVVTAIYDDEREANSVYDRLIRLHEDELRQIVDAAVLWRDSTGTVHIAEDDERSPTTGAKRGAVIGVLAGLMFPPTRVVGAATGAAAGALVSYLIDRGFDDRELRAMGVSLQSGQAAIFALAQARWASQLAGYLHSSIRLASYTLPGEIVMLVTASVEGGRPIDGI